MGYQTIQVIRKALAVLEIINAPGGGRRWSFARLKEETALPPGTLRNILRTLEECGYVENPVHGVYTEGERGRLIFFSGAVFRKLRKIAEPVLIRAVNEIKESLLMVSIIHGKRYELLRYAAPEISEPIVRLQSNADKHTYRQLTTRMLLAHMSRGELESFIRLRGLPDEADWPECGNSETGLYEELSKIREQKTLFLRQKKLLAFAVPVIMADNSVPAALGCYVRTGKCDEAQIAELLCRLQSYAAEISEVIRIN